jgi:ribulose-5-phosphate 4-epimerase/fuculose-1-phosphate aldolase
MSNATPAGSPSQPLVHPLIDDLVIANRILYAQHVVDGFGHVSARDPDNPQRFYLSRSKAPGTVTAADILTYDLAGEPVEPTGHKLYLERYIHSALYAQRPDVMAVVHSHSPAVIPFGITPVALQPVFHIGGFLAPAVPVFEIRDTAGPATDLLIRNQELGLALARALGQRNVVLMRGHGSTAVGNSIPQAVYRAIYTEVNARLQADAMRLGPVNFLTPQEAAAAAASNDSVIERIWGLWKAEATEASR